MVTARPAKSAYLAIIILVAALALPTSAWAASGNVQVCSQGTTCPVGEFLYDDSYAPIASATCTLMSRYPDGSIFVNSQPMTSASDGWYSYDIVATGSAGVYRSQICCTSGSDYLCLDKTFEVATASSTLTQTDVAGAVWNATRSSYTTTGSFGQALQNIVPSSNDIAVAVWGYSARTLSGFGTLVADIWAYSTRSITTFGTLASDIWSSTTRTLTGNSLSDGKLAKESDVSAVKDDVKAVKDDVAKIKTDVTSVTNVTNNYSDSITNIETVTNENRALLEQVINKPIIKNFLEEETTPDLSQKINASKAVAVQLSTNVEYASNKISHLKNRWSTLPKEDMLLALQDISLRVGGEEDREVKSMFGSILWLGNAWGWQMTDQLVEETKLLKSSLAYLYDDINSYGKTSFGQSQLGSISQSLASISNITGTQIDKSTIRSIFGKIIEVEERSLTLEIQQKEIKSLLGTIGKDKNQDESRKITALSQDVQQVSVILTPVSHALYEQEKETNVIKYYRNKLLALLGVIQANKRFLARNSNTVLASTWLEEGSIVFKSLVTNPSNLISQTIPVTLYLPAEVKKEHILSVEEGFNLSFDTEKTQFYIEGTVTLAPLESKTITVRVEDIWQISEAEVASIRKQADELYKPLVNTSYFGQAVTIKSDIDVSLDRILEMQKTATTPESKLRVYKDAQIEFNAVKTKIEKLKELVSLASSAGSLVGFVGGAQAIAVWGLIIIMAAGFVFLVIYMRMLSMREAVLTKGGKVKIKETKQKHETKEPKPSLHTTRLQRMVRFAVPLLTFGAISAFSSAIVMFALMSHNNQSVKEIGVENTKAVLGEEKKEEVASSTTAPVEKIVDLVIPKGETVVIRKYPLATAQVVGEISDAQSAKWLDETTNWVKISLDPTENSESTPTVGWVEKEFILSKYKEVSQAMPADSPRGGAGRQVSKEKSIVLINDTPTGFLRVRQTPGGVEIGQVAPGNTFPFIDELNGWVQIEREDGAPGWISKQYATIDSQYSSFGH